MTDRFRQSVYRAEDQWSSVMDRGGTVDFFGSTLQLPTQIRFGSLADVRTYVNHVCSTHGIAVPAIRHRRGGSRAHYEQGTIAIPADRAWAMRESVVLHELAHHVCITDQQGSHHDARFTGAMLALVQSQLGAEAALLLRTGYHSAGAPV